MVFVINNNYLTSHIKAQVTK